MSYLVMSPKTLVLSWIVATVLLTACGTPPPRRPPPPAGIMEVTARLAAPPEQAVNVRVGNLPPGRSIEQVVLLDPEGTRHAAESLMPVRGTESGVTSGPSVGVRITGGSSSRITPSLSLGGNITGAEPKRDSQRVEARIPIPDPAAYRAEAPRWRIEVSVTELDGARRTLTFPAARAP